MNNIGAEAKIITYLEKRGRAKPSELVLFLEISERAVFKQLKKLYERGVIEKAGRPPRVYYSLKPSLKEVEGYSLPSNERKYIEDRYFIVTPEGERKEGIDGFEYWCRRLGLPVEKTAKEYIRTLLKYEKFRKRGLIDATYKLKDTFNEIFIDRLYYIDFYSIERFGKTKLGWMLLYAKQSQSKELTQEVTSYVKGSIEKAIKRLRIDAVGYVPPTIRRDVQLMKELEKELNLSLPVIKIVKLKTPIVVPQKSLSKLEDRIDNARNTIEVEETRQFKNVLLIDDAVGSGATMNETARKIRKDGVASGKIYGLAITGSFKGFEIISEV